MELLHTHSNDPTDYIRIDIYNLVIWLNDPTDTCLRPWDGKIPVQEMSKVTKRYYETISNI